jgi:hypothetical protein
MYLTNNCGIPYTDPVDETQLLDLEELGAPVTLLRTVTACIEGL